MINSDANSSPSTSVLMRILKATLTLPAKITFFGAALGAVALIAGGPAGLAGVPDGLVVLTGTVGMNALTDFLKQIIGGKEVTNDEILKTLSKAIEDSHVEQKIYEHDTQVLIAKLFRQMDVLKYSLMNQDLDVLQRITQQGIAYEAFMTEMQDVFSELLTVAASIDNKNTKIYEQTTEILSIIREILSTFRTLEFGNENDEKNVKPIDDLIEQYCSEVVTRFTFSDFKVGYINKSLQLKDIYVNLPLVQPHIPENLFSPVQPSQINGDALTTAVDLFQKTQHGALVDKLGMGKTTTLQRLAWLYGLGMADSLEWRVGELKPFYVPIRKLAYHWTDDRFAEGYDGFLNALATSVTGVLGSKIATADILRIVSEILGKDQGLLLLDALDEEEHQIKFVEKMRSISDQLGNNLILITSRPYKFLSPQGFKMFTFQPLTNDHVGIFISKLGRALLEAREDLSLSEKEILQWLRTLKETFSSPQFREFRSPFYLTLMIYLGASKSSATEARGYLTDFHRLGDLYERFLLETLNWEKAKGNDPDSDDQDCYSTLGFIAYYTFVDPHTRSVLADKISETTKIDRDQVQRLIQFWLKAGLLNEDGINGPLVFQHSGFQKYAIALALCFMASSPKLKDIVTELHDAYLKNLDWDSKWRDWGLIWRLFEKCAPKNWQG